MDQDTKGLNWEKLKEKFDKDFINFVLFSTPTFYLFKSYELREIRKQGKRIIYRFSTPKNFNSELYFIKDNYTDEEFTLITDLFKNLDQGNLAIIKGILHSKVNGRKFL